MEITKRRLKYGSNALLFTVALIVAAVLLYGLLDRHPLRWDLTQNKEFSISDQTQKVLQGLKQEIQITAYFRKGGDAEDIFIRRKVDDTLHEYSRRSPYIHYQIFNPDVDIEKTLGDQIASDGTIVFQSAKNRKDIYKSQLFDYSNMNEKSLPEFVGEGLFTNALLKVTHNQAHKICFLEGHGERKTDDTSPSGLSEIKNYLGKNNYEVASFSFITSPDIPSDCDSVMIADSQIIPEAEEQKIVEWTNRGGKLFLLLEPTKPVPLSPLLNSWHLSVSKDLVLDPQRHFLLGPHFPAPILGDHEITKDLQNMSPILSTARSLKKEGEVSDISINPLLTTTNESWGETNLSDKVEPRFDPGQDEKGPLTLGVAISKGETPLAVVVGDTDFLSNGLIQAPGNLDLALNMFGWLVGDKEQVTIRPKTPEFRNISLTENRARFVSYFSQLGYPVLILMSGGLYWFRRRKL